MSDNIPLEIQAEIIKRLPIKSVIRFRAVSKPWKSLIDKPDFNLCHTEPHHLLVSYYSDNDKEQKYVSIIDDNTFPQHKSSLTPPTNFSQIGNLITGSSHGLFCLYSYNDVSTTKPAVIWNPTIRKSVVISVPNVLYFPYRTVIGFGVCPNTRDPKLVKFMYTQNYEFDTKVISSRVEICSSKSTVWRTVSNNLPRKSIALKYIHVAIGRFIYWLGYDRNNVGTNTVRCSTLILLFDITNEQFTEEITFPDSLQGSYGIRISKLRDSLIVLQTDRIDEKQVYDVWMMENCVSKSFIKLYTIKAPDALYVNVLGFRKTGEPIIEMMSHTDENNQLFVYKSDTEQVSSIGISQNGFSCFASSYVESLLLLDH